MSTFRSGARHASRHQGRMYDRGYQFRYPQREKLIFGPWEAVWPMSERALPQNVLQSLMDGALIDGVIMPIWRRTAVDNVGQVVLGARELTLGQESFSLVFYKAASQLHVKHDNGAGTQGTHTYAIDPASGRIEATAWQQDVYFVSPTLGLVRKYTPSTGAFAAIADSPTNGKFAFILENNLVVIRQAGSIYEAVWAPDSLPEAWTAAGSGTNPLYGIGAVKGVAVFSDRAIIVGTAGAKVMLPTGGGASAFAFRDVKTVHGTPFDYGVAFSQDSMFYLGYDRQLRIYTGESVREVGFGEGVLFGSPLLFYSERLGYLVLTVPSTNTTLFFDPATNHWVSDLNIAWDFVTDSPLADNIGHVFGLRNVGADHTHTTLELEPEFYTLPRITFGKVDFDGEEWVIEHIDLHRTDVDSPLPLSMTLRRITAFDNIDEDRYAPDGLTDILEKGHRIRYFVNRPAATANIFLSVDELASVFLSGPYLVGEDYDGGNIPLEPLNTPSGWLGDLRLDDGNLDIEEDSTEYTSSGALAITGNLDLVAVSQLEWRKNTGIDRAEVVIKRQSLQRVGS